MDGSNELLFVYVFFVVVVFPARVKKKNHFNERATKNTETKKKLVDFIHFSFGFPLHAIFHLQAAFLKSNGELTLKAL